MDEPEIRSPGSIYWLGRMLKVSKILDEGLERGIFEIQEDGAPASPQTLDRVALFAKRLLQENKLPGSFGVSGPGLLALDLRAPERSFFHTGIVFAALDAFDNPRKNPTITRRPTADN